LLFDTADTNGCFVVRNVRKDFSQRVLVARITVLGACGRATPVFFFVLVSPRHTCASRTLFAVHYFIFSHYIKCRCWCVLVARINVLGACGRATLV
jgi:hypothetical protein